MKKITLFLSASIIVFSFAPLMANAQATSVQAQLQALEQQLSQLQNQANGISPAPTTAANSASASAYTFITTMTVGAQNPEVSALQLILINDGYLTAITTPSGYFGQATKTALIKYQQANGISPATGYFGSLTMASVNGKTTTSGATQPSPQPSTNSTPTTPVVSVQSPPVPSVPPQPSPISLSGQGQQATQKFTLTQGLAVFSLTNNGGTSNFSAELLDSNGNLVSLLANTVGSFSGSQGVNISNAGTYLINVTSNGNWTINITQPRTSAAPSTTSFSGHGEQATQLFYLPAGLQVYYMAHNGQANFSVELLDQNGNLISLLANTVGSFNGSQAVTIQTAGLYMFDVQADGNWAISTSPVSVPSTPSSVSVNTTTQAPTPAPQTNNQNTSSASNETVSQTNAVAKAIDYLNYSGFSYEGLIAQLEYDQFSQADATYGADNSGANWDAEAAEKAKEYMGYSAFSSGGLIAQLEYDKFTPAQAEYGANAVGL